METKSLLKVKTVYGPCLINIAKVFGQVRVIDVSGYKHEQVAAIELSELYQDKSAPKLYFDSMQAAEIIAAHIRSWIRSHVEEYDL